MTTTAELLKTPLYDWHVAHGGRMVEFGGWSMPVQYTSISEEHNATRNAVGVFDISHMGRLELFGRGAARFIDGVVTRRVTDMKVGQIRYALVCNAQGGILDDVLVYRLRADDYASSPTSDDESATFQIVVNASNRGKIVEWLLRRTPDHAVRLADVTRETAMIAVQGPLAIRLTQFLIDRDLMAIRYYSGASSSFFGKACFVSRTGYTGEDGCEIICRACDALSIWERVIEIVQPPGGHPVGLGARDTLRLEAAMPLYGHELSESINPIQAGLNFAVNLQNREFVGCDAIAKFEADKQQPLRIGLQLEGKRVPRQGCPVLHNDEIVGEVTSGTFSPTFERPIAMAYVRPSAGAVGTRLAVDVRGTQHPALVVSLPFYERNKSGS